MRPGVEELWLLRILLLTHLKRQSSTALHGRGHKNFRKRGDLL